MNPWDILAWVTAISLSIIVLAITIAVVIALVNPRKTNTSTTRPILQGRKG